MLMGTAPNTNQTTQPHPKTPTPATIAPPIISPPKNTPSKLRRFLEHAEDRLGVRDAHIYEGVLENRGYGPDILHLVSDTDLEACGFNRGDVLRLKRGAADWWNGPEAKKPKLDNPRATTPPPEYNIRFEKRFHMGGSVSLFGSGIYEAPAPDPKVLPVQYDYDYWYHNPVTKRLEQMPEGYLPDLDPAGMPNIDGFTEYNPGNEGVGDDELSGGLGGTGEGLGE